MNIDLSSELEELVRSKVASGLYGSTADVLKDALGLLEERELYLASHESEIREKIARGYASLRAGKGVDGEAMFKRIEKELVGVEQVESLPPPA